MAGKVLIDPMERFFSKVEVSNKTGCWSWIDHLEHGYGVFTLRGHVFRAHRFSYMIFASEVPNGMELDHLCRNRKCVNPEHLEIVTRAENFARGTHPSTTRKIKIVCNNGHPLNGYNAVKRKEGGTICRVCKRTYSRHLARNKLGVKKPYRKD